MNRALRNLLFLCVGLWLGAFSVLSFAETIPATSTSPCDGSVAYLPDVGGAYCSLDLMCAGVHGSGWYWHTGALKCADGVNEARPTPYTMASTVYSCPADQGWTLSGDQCVRPDCVAPAVRLPDGTCGASCTAGQQVGPITFNGTVSGAACVSGGCATFNGCQVGNCTSGYSFGTGDARVNVWKGCTMTGAQGTSGAPQASGSAPDPNAPPTPQSCVDQGKGYITNSSGTTVCLAQGSSPGLQTTKSDTGTKTTTDPAGTTTTQNKGTTTTQTCDDAGNCNVTRTTTTTTTTTPPGGTPTTTTTQQSDTQDRGSFCEENPSASICKEEQDPCDENPERLGCASFGDVQDSQLQSKAIGASSVLAVSVPMNNSCPADIALPEGMSFSWKPICDGLGWFRPLVLALAWLSAAYIVIGGSKEAAS